MRLTASPAFWSALYSEFLANGGNADTSTTILVERLGGNVRSGNLSGAKPPEALVRFVAEELGFKRTVDAYSSTESHAVLRNGCPDCRNGVTVQLIDVPDPENPAGPPLHTAAAGVGELVVASPTLFRGYYRDPAATARATVVIDGTRYYRTGDVARVVTTGTAGTGAAKYEIVDRISSMVRMGFGEFVSPEAAEAKLASCASDLLDHVYVHARPGEDRVVHVAVPSLATAGGSSSDLLALVRQRIADQGDRFEGWEIPRGLVVVEPTEFARWRDRGLVTALGKKVRGAIAAAYKHELEAIYAFEHQARCTEMIQRGGPGDFLVGSLALAVRADPEYLRTATGSLQELGLDSMAGAVLVGQLKSRHDRSLPLPALLQLGVGELVAFALGGALASRDTAALLARVEADSAIPPALAARIARQQPRARARTVLVTGATGVLGATMVVELLLETDKDCICLVRDRANNPEAAMARVLSAVHGVLGGRESMLSVAAMARLTVVCGDLDRPRFGLPAAEHAALADRADIIIHSAALVNHVLDYGRHRGPNVHGTLRVLEFASAGAGNAQVHFLSTAAAAAMAPTTDTLFWEHTSALTSSEAAAARLGGYVLSKYVSERLCRAAAASSLRVTIYRPGICVSNSASGFCKPTDFYPRLLMAMEAHGIYPDVDLDARYDMTPSDFVAAGIVRIAVQPWSSSDKSSEQPRCFHPMSRGHLVPFSTLVDGVRLARARSMGKNDSSPSAELAEVSFDAFTRIVAADPEFAPIMHELRATGLPGTRRFDPARFYEVYGAGARADAVAVTPETVARCIGFLQRPGVS